MVMKHDETSAELEQTNNKLARVKQFLGLNDFVCQTDDLVDSIREMCVERMCRAVGIKFRYNRSNKFFQFFSSFMGQAVVDECGIKLKVAPDALRLVKYDGINFVSMARKFLKCEDLDEAFINGFNLADDNKKVMEYLQKI